MDGPSTNHKYQNRTMKEEEDPVTEEKMNPNREDPLQLDTEEILLFAVDKDYSVRADLPPLDYNYDLKAAQVGKLTNVSHIAFDPEGHLYAVRGKELYMGPMPPSKNQDWFADAKRVGKADWDNVQFFFFHPKGELYVATTEGELYKGPAPSNENVSWLNRQAKKIGYNGWQDFDALFFDPEGVLYAVTSYDILVKGNPPTDPERDWIGYSTKVGRKGWRVLSHFISFSPNGNLWCVNKNNGNIYCGPPPTKENPDYLTMAKHLGHHYNHYKLFSFTKGIRIQTGDKTIQTGDEIIQSVVSFDFLPDMGKKESESLEIVASQNYVNKDSAHPLQCTFVLNETIRNRSSFALEQGYTFGALAEVKFEAGIPFIESSVPNISINENSSHTWSLIGSNKTAKPFAASTSFEVPGGRSVRLVASVTRAKISVPYYAKVRTVSGSETTITGTWNGDACYNFTVKKEDV
ncbi:uncharacterized protein O3C94_021395 isoform 2-T2 [Discoglossus pictus]